MGGISAPVLRREMTSAEALVLGRLKHGALLLAVPDRLPPASTSTMRLEPRRDPGAVLGDFPRARIALPYCANVVSLYQRA